MAGGGICQPVAGVSVVKSKAELSVLVAGNSHLASGISG